MRPVKTISLAALLLLVPPESFALAPPTGQGTLCFVKGKVLNKEQTDATDDAMNPVSVPSVTLEVQEIHAVDPNYTGSFCALPGPVEMPSLYVGKKSINTYRVCDLEVSVFVGDTIQGTAGRSLGGGPYCIDKINIIQ